MKVSPVSSKLNFTSGLNKNLIRQCNDVDVKQVKKALLSRHIESDFQNCKPVAFGVKQVLEMFEDLKNKTGARLFNLSIPAIETYSKQDLIFDFTGQNFCLPETCKVLKGTSPFKTGSLFFEKEDSLETLSDKLDASYAKNMRSSSHYLAPFVHEFMHNVYLNYIYLKYGYEGVCPYTKSKYMLRDKNNKGLEVLSKLQNLTFSDSENKTIASTLGLYAIGKQNQYHEVFAETFTKLFCDSLADNGKPNKNPLENIRNLPSNFLVILNKVIDPDII